MHERELRHSSRIALLRGAAAIGIAMSAAGCAPALVVGSFGDPAFVAPPAAGAAPAALSGCWVGRYHAPTFARRGRVVMTLRAEPSPARPVANRRALPDDRTDGAAGWLLISAAPTGGSAADDDAADACAPAGDRTTTSATRRAVRVPEGVPVRVPLRAAIARSSGAVEIRSEPYWDVDCGCTLVLTLAGRHVGDTLAGAFSARAAATAVPEPRGQWRVVRTTVGSQSGRS